MSTTKTAWFWMLFAVGFLNMVSSPNAFGGQPERWAFLIGIDDYLDLTPLESSSSDAIQLGQVLQERCGFNPNHVSVLARHPGQSERETIIQLRHRTIDARLRSFIKAAEQNNVQSLLIYYSGHGCLVPSETLGKPDDLLLPAINGAESDGRLINAISRNDLQSLLAKVDVPEKILVLDCCHAANPQQVPLRGKAFIVQGKKAKPGPPQFSKLPLAPPTKKSSFVILAGSTFEQIASEQVFTRHLIDGLSSARDADRDRMIDLSELFKHVRATMSTSSNQQPDMQAVQGQPENISLAPAVIQLDPERLARVYVEKPDRTGLADSQVSLMFRPNAGGNVVTLGRSKTDSLGKAELTYRFYNTEGQPGRYQISLTPSDKNFMASVTNLNDLVNLPSPAYFKLSARPAQGGAGTQPAPASRIIKGGSSRPSATKPKPAARPIAKRPPAREPTFQEALDSVAEYVRTRDDIDSVCEFKDFFPEYKKLIDQLRNNQKLQVHGVALCFPSESTWLNDTPLRTKIIRILNQNGVVGAGRGILLENFDNLPQPTFGQVKNAAFDYVRRLEVDVCGLKTLVPGYREKIDMLDKHEKFEVLPGLPICFPSEATWNAKPQFRDELIDILRNGRAIKI